MVDDHELCEQAPGDAGASEDEFDSFVYVIIGSDVFDVSIESNGGDPDVRRAAGCRSW